MSSNEAARPMFGLELPDSIAPAIESMPFMTALAMALNWLQTVANWKIKSNFTTSINRSPTGCGRICRSALMNTRMIASDAATWSVSPIAAAVRPN